MTTQSHDLQALAARFELELRGNASVLITGIATLERAGAGQITFLANPAYRKHLLGTAASAVILRAADAEHCPVPCLVANDPYSTFAQIAALFAPVATRKTGIHPSAVIHDTARVSATASIAEFVSIGAHSVIGDRAVIGAGSVIGEDCTIGADCELIARVTLVKRVRLGNRVRLHPGVVVGADGFGLAMNNGRWINVPQLGGVQIGDDCEIGANTTIDCGAIDDTVLEEDVRLDNQIQVAHNVRIGAHTAMAGCVAVAGSTKIGRYCLIGGGVGIVGHIEICDKVTVTARSLVTHSLTEPGEYSSGTPIQPNRLWRRNAARFKQLDELARKLAAMPKTKD